MAVPFFMMGQVLLALYEKRRSAGSGRHVHHMWRVLNIIGDIYLVFVRIWGIEGRGAGDCGRSGRGVLIFYARIFEQTEWAAEADLRQKTAVD